MECGRCVCCYVLISLIFFPNPTGLDITELTDDDGMPQLEIFTHPTRGQTDCGLLRIVWITVAEMSPGNGMMASLPEAREETFPPGRNHVGEIEITKGSLNRINNRVLRVSK